VLERKYGRGGYIRTKTEFIDERML